MLHSPRSTGGPWSSSGWRRSSHSLDEQAPLVEAPAELVRGRLVEERERHQVVLPDRQDSPVEVPPLDLDGRGEPGEGVPLRLRDAIEALQIEDYPPAGLDLGPPALVLGKQLRDGDTVEVGQLREPGDRDVAVPPLVGAHDRGLPPAPRGLLDVVKRHPLLYPDVAQALAQRPRVLRPIGRGYQLAPSAPPRYKRFDTQDARPSPLSTTFRIQGRGRMRQSVRELQCCHESDMEGRRYVRAGQHPGPSLFSRAGEEPQVPHAPRGGRGPHPLPEGLRDLRQGGDLGRHRQGLRVREGPVRT